MQAQKSQPEKQQSPVAPIPAMTLCRKQKRDSATFLEDVNDRIDEFIHASMHEHKTCFKKTIQKMFGMSKIVAETNANTNGAQTTVSDQNIFSQAISQPLDMGF